MALAVLVHDTKPSILAMPLASFTASILPSIAMHDVVSPTDTDLKAAIERPFEETGSAPHRWTKAVVVVHNGRVLAERYAAGYGVDTPLAG